MIIVGADESGTGAWAGPYTVCAAAIAVDQQDLLVQLGARDSKKMTDERRRRVMNDLIDALLVAKVVVRTPDDLRAHGKTPTWQTAMVEAVTHVCSLVGADRIVVDGVVDLVVRKELWDRFRIRAEFMPKADDLVPVVSAASIIAKTVRNDLMNELHQQYPEYCWNTNAGYGSAEHNTALSRYGKTEHHRPWKNLIDIPMRSHAEDT